MTRFVPLVVALAFIACGGAFEGGGDEPGGQAGSSSAGVPGASGSSGAAGSGARAGTGSGGDSGGSCEWGGETYADGESWAAACNTCSCDKGQVSCTTAECGGDTCLYDGITYLLGDSFPATDGCNTCTCESGGAVSCTLLPCVLGCEEVAALSGELVDQAKICDPQAMDQQCTQVVAGQLDCGCPTYVNPENTTAINELARSHEQYAELMCGPSPCDCASPGWAYCSANGQCVDVWDGSATACKVNGQIYMDGETGIPGLFGCNTCACTGGSLICTVDDPCPSACPPDSVPGPQCAQCGPNDGCQIVELTCLPVCTDTCEFGNGICVQGTCQNVCG